MRLAVLGSGSGGNALIVESGKSRLLVDAGFSCGRIVRQLRELGIEPRTVGGLVLSHEHEDHVRGVRVLKRRFDLPFFATAGTLKGLDPETAAAGETIRSGVPFLAAGFQVEAFRLPHDAREPVGFVVEAPDGCRLGVVSDLGSRSRLAWGRLHDLDALVIEANHDLSMLRSGPYPWHLKERVASRHGHLSNREAALGVSELVSNRLRHVVLYHLSRTNNEPALAVQEVGCALEREGSRAALHVTRQDEATAWIDVLPHGQLQLAWG